MKKTYMTPIAEIIQIAARESMLEPTGGISNSGQDSNGGSCAREIDFWFDDNNIWDDWIVCPHNTTTKQD